VRTGRAIPLSSEGAVIGRDADCDVVVTGKGVSRRHAVIAPVVGGFALTDQSANGTQVNGLRLVGPHELSPGDVLRVDAEEFRVHVGGAPPGVRTRADATIVMTSVADPNAKPERPAVVPTPPPGGMATLRIIGGPLGRAEFRLDRPVCAIGRGPDNDVRLQHDSVSTAHASLLRKGGSWFVVDLGSANGTFLAGYRVSGERALSSGSVLTFGSVKCSFRPRAADSLTPRAVRRVPRESLLGRLAAILFRRGGS
jgi:ABC transport system ATP-binding/permease protein